MNGFLALGLGLGLVLTGGHAGKAVAQRVDFPDYKQKPLREWLQALIYREGSKIGMDAREALDQYCNNATIRGRCHLATALGFEKK